MSKVSKERKKLAKLSIWYKEQFVTKSINSNPKMRNNGKWLNEIIKKDK